MEVKGILDIFYNDIDIILTVIFILSQAFLHA